MPTRPRFENPRRDFQRLLISIAVVGLILGFAGAAFVAARAPKLRGDWLTRAGYFGEANRAYVAAMRKGPVTLPLIVDLLAVRGVPERVRDAEGGSLGRQEIAAVPETHDVSLQEIGAALDAPSTPADVRLLGRFWLTVHGGGSLAELQDLSDEVRLAADADPPMPFANHLLAKQASMEDDLDEAVVRYRREAIFFPERASDLDEAVELLEAGNDWPAVRHILDDRELSKRLSGGTRLHAWMHEKKILPALAGAVHEVLRKPELPPLLMTAVCALSWLAFCAQLGDARRRPQFRIPIYLTAIFLGILSIAPTLLLIEAETVFLHLRMTGKPLYDFIYFTFGVGFREELSKLLLFLPLLPALRKWGNKRDVLVCGALVGLGFAVEENLNYFARGDFGDGIGRFLTANFLHMSMTALTASALDDFAKNPSEASYDFTKTLLSVMALHGVYDFFIVEKAYGNLGYFSMLVFVLLARQFLDKATTKVPRIGERGLLLRVFAVGTTTITATSFAVSSSLIGPIHGFGAMFEGLVGVAVISFMFVRGLEGV